MKKSEVRKVYSEKKELLTETEVHALSEKIFENFLSKFQLREYQKVHCFLSIPEKGEVETNLFLNYFFENKIRVFVPKIIKGKLISLEITEETPLLESTWGIKEPTGSEDCGVKDYDFVITPLLYADQFGNRVGYGKGFYDKFLSKCKPNVVKIGLSFFEPEELIEDVFENDVKLDFCVNPNEIISFI